MSNPGIESPNPLTLTRKAGAKCGAAYSYIQIGDKKGAVSLLMQAKADIEEAIIELEKTCGAV